jgi:hypothetical protein
VAPAAPDTGAAVAACAAAGTVPVSVSTPASAPPRARNSRLLDRNPSPLDVENRVRTASASRSSSWSDRSSSNRPASGLQAT